MASCSYSSFSFPFGVVRVLPMLCCSVACVDTTVCLETALSAKSFSSPLLCPDSDDGDNGDFGDFGSGDGDDDREFAGEFVGDIPSVSVVFSLFPCSCFVLLSSSSISEGMCGEEELSSMSISEGIRGEEELSCMSISEGIRGKELSCMFFSKGTFVGGLA